MQKRVLFLQGGGEGAHAEDQVLVDYVKKNLGDQFEVSYPECPGLESIDYPVWRSQAIDTFNTLEA